ncbi:MAG: CRISPR-associated helicase Cas3' [Firmicutes bacterium]|nr:CRISPR-associated helicase Cas3' [Bacillota bacterium]
MKVNTLSPAAKSLWAKKTSDGNMHWLPLWVHMADSAAVAQMLWNRWLPDGVKRAVCAAGMSEDQAEQLFVFLAAAHDIGKATPVFQAKPSRPLCPALDERIAESLNLGGLPMRHYSEFKWAGKTPHALATQVLLEHAGCNRNTAVILGTHHGKPPGNDLLMSRSIESYGFNYHLENDGKEAWAAIWEELIGYALSQAGYKSVEDIPNPNIPAQVLLSGLLIMTDWIASNTELFPYISLEDRAESINVFERSKTAWKNLGIPVPWDAGNAWMSADLYKERFNFDAPLNIQSVVAEVTMGIRSPGIFVLEAPMGSGKTEAALVAAEVFASISKRSGVFFALPTQATSDGIFPRMLEWVKRLESEGNHSIRLAHGNAQFNEEYESLRFFGGKANISDDEIDGVMVHGWFEGRKKSLLADFVVGTIDQLLLAALKQKHVMLRHLGLANKVVIIDECHAYDAYMSRYLDIALRWLGVYKVPVIVLSATLPAQKRMALVNAYLNTHLSSKPKADPLGRGPAPVKEEPTWAAERSYPLITYTDGEDIRQSTVSIDKEKSRKVLLLPLTEEEVVNKLEDLLSDGGCAGVIVNTVQRSQTIARELRNYFGHETVRLLHSRFLAPDRIEKERELLKELGKRGPDNRRPYKRVIIGTQVLEQSLDIDFDVMITDLCPMDLLLQRIGRLHRHARPRPDKLQAAICFVMGLNCEEFEPGAKSIYGEYLLMRTKEFLPEQLTLPEDIPNLVQDVYDENVPIASPPPGYREAKKKWDRLIQNKERRAEAFRIDPPWTDSNLTISGWLDKDVSDHKGKAAVRDSDESLEVLLIQESKGRLYMLGMEDGPELPTNVVPDDVVAKTLARQRIRLPNVLGGHWIIDQTIAELEQLNVGLLVWQESPWLKGELFLILDENSSAHLCGYKLTYDKNDGLLYEKEDE